MRYRNAEVYYWTTGIEDSWIRWKLFNAMREIENVNLQKLCGIPILEGCILLI